MTIEKVRELIGEYSAKIMVENPKWVFNANDAEELAQKIMKEVQN